jgi:hypothetical protein
VGLFPPELAKKICPLGNSSLQGAARYACSSQLPRFVKNAVYRDLSSDAVFTELFMENMELGGKFTSL